MKFASTLFLFFLVFLIGASGATAAVAELKILHEDLHFESEKAEICFTLSHPVDISDRSRLAASFVLQKNGKRQKLDPRDLSLTPTDICLQNLDHRERYSVLVQKLTGKEGQRLESPHTISFSVPDRRQFLRFADSAGQKTFMRYNEMKGQDVTGSPPILMSMNVKETHLTLYRITDPSLLTEAWRQFQQMHLSPSESLYFARTKGQNVFESDLILNDTPNEEQKVEVPLPEQQKLTAGIYYLSAAPKGKQGKNPALFAGQWFLVSDLRLASVRVPEGGHFFAFYDTKHQPAVQAHIMAWSKKGEVLAEGKTDDNGEFFLKLDRDKQKDLFLVTVSDGAGMIDLQDMTNISALPVDSLSLQSVILKSKEVYAPEEQVTLTLLAQDQGGKNIPLEGSVLKLMRPDGSLEFERAVQGPSAEGSFTIAFTAPLVGQGGAWPLLWVDKEGRVLKEEKLVVVRDTAVHKVVLSSEGNGRASVRVLDEKGNGLPFRNGEVRIVHAMPQLKDWPAYVFGTEKSKGQTETPALSLPFMTDEKGVAQISFPVRGEHKDFWQGAEAITIEASIENSLRTAELFVPLEREDVWVGVKALSNTTVFPENSLASFDVIVLDGSGHRRVEKGLYYIVYEEGRSFEWFLSEGQWAYRLLPEHRRVGGGKVHSSATTDGRITWPVTTGSYVLEITDERGKILTRRSFGVGQDVGGNVQKEDTLPQWNAARKELSFALSVPSMVHVFWTDGQGWHTRSRFMQAGVQKWPLSTTDKEGHKALVYAQILPASFGAPLKSELMVDLKPMGSVPSEGQSGPSGDLASGEGIKVRMEVPPLLQAGDILGLEAEITALKAGTYTYVVEPTEGLNLSGATKGKLVFKKDKNQKIAFSLQSPQKGDGALTLSVTGSDGKTWTQRWPVIVGGVSVAGGSLRTERLEDGKIWEKPKEKTDKKAQVMGYLLSSLPLPDVVSLLEKLALTEPQTTKEIALWLAASEAWRPALELIGAKGGRSFDVLSEAYKRQLKLSQNIDGGFPVMQAGQPSDFDSTSAALRVLTETAAPEAKRAAAWLNQKLKNTWFEETEREARAFAFEAVASRHEADLSALRYFAEKSRDKNLSASSQVALARALAQSGDAEAAGYWFELARKTLANAPEEEAIRALYFFSAHGKEGIGTVLSVMNALKMEEVSSSFPSSARLLLALSQTVASDGSWVVQVDGGESKHTGFWSLPLSSSTVKNMAARPLYVTAFLKGKEGGGVQEKGEQGVSLIPTFYRLSGEKVVEGDFLLRQEPYLLLLKMVCHSACPQEMRVNLPFKAVLDAQTIGGGDESVARSVFPWLGDNIGSLEGWSQTPTSFGFVLKEIKKEKTVALLVKPLYAGTFTLPLAQIRSDEKDVLFDQPFVRVKIQ